MTFDDFNVGGPIQIQYEVFRKKEAPELVWYDGTIVGLELVSEISLKVTVWFEGSDSFHECEETFIADTSGKLSQKGREFPFKIPSSSNSLACCTSGRQEESVSVSPPKLAQFLSTISSLETRVRALERKVALQIIPPIYMTVCSALNKSLKKFRNGRHKLQSNIDETSSSTWKVTQACTHSDFKLLFEYLKTLSQSLEVEGDDDRTTASYHISITIPSFKVFCTLFSISNYNYESLLYCYQSNRKGQLTSSKCIGSIIEKKEMPSLPSILCVGGNAQRWCNSNYFFVKENGHTLNTGGSACDYERVMSREDHTMQCAAIEDVTGSDLTVSWFLDDSSDICRPCQEGAHFIGKLTITLPYIIFNDARVATKIHKWLCPNRELSDSSDSSSSSS